MQTDDNERDLPPYDDRQKSGEVEDAGSERDDARVGGATGPVEDDAPKAPDPADTPRGGVASPGDEQPAADPPDSGGPGGTGPSHEPGTGRGEDHAR